MERYTFDEIKEFKMDDIFWAKNDKWKVSDTPSYYNQSRFYGDFSEKVEWKAISETTLQQHTFTVHNVREGAAEDPLIFKTATSEPMIATSNIKKD